MFISEFMTRKVVTVSSNTTLDRASWMLHAHNVRRLPVVDNGKLVGLVGEKIIAAALPLSTATQSELEAAGTLATMVHHIMNKEVVTVTPDTTAETALAIAQENHVGSLVVVNEKHEVVGIVTTNDFVNKILNPLLGRGKPGTRIHIYDCHATHRIAEVTMLIDKHSLQIEALHLDDSFERKSRDLIVQVDTEKPSGLIRDLEDRGYKVEIRKRRYWPSAAGEPKINNSHQE